MADCRRHHRLGGQQGTFLNIIVGIVGTFLGGMLGFGGGDISDGNFSLPGLLMSLIGSVVLLAIINLFCRGCVR